MNTPNTPEPDAFERRLHNVPLRPPPAAWRERILDATAPVASTASGEPRRRRLAAWLGDLLWPSPHAWVGVAATWIVILTVNHFAAPEPSATYARRAPSGSAAFASFSFIAHRMKLAELLEIEISPPAPPRPPTTPGPRGALTNTNHTA